MSLESHVLAAEPAWEVEKEGRENSALLFNHVSGAFQKGT